RLLVPLLHPPIPLNIRAGMRPRTAHAMELELVNLGVFPGLVALAGFVEFADGDRVRADSAVDTDAGTEALVSILWVRDAFGVGTGLDLNADERGFHREFIPDLDIEAGGGAVAVVGT